MKVNLLKVPIYFVVTWFVLLASPGCVPAPTEPKVEKGKEEDGPPSRSAQVGVGKKGEGYGEMVPYLKPAATYWKIKEKIVFEIAIPKTMQLYEALHGRKPKSHEEFMEEIVKKNKIKLPELKDGLEYQYDPELGELMVTGNEKIKQ
jgi:hypothetical protein